MYVSSGPCNLSLDCALECILALLGKNFHLYLRFELSELFERIDGPDARSPSRRQGVKAKMNCTTLGYIDQLATVWPLRIKDTFIW